MNAKHSFDDAAAPREILGRLNITPQDFEGTYYFYGTGAGAATFQREGILPLGQVIDRKWTSLHPLVADG